MEDRRRALFDAFEARSRGLIGRVVGTPIALAAGPVCRVRGVARSPRCIRCAASAHRPERLKPADAREGAHPLNRPGANERLVPPGQRVRRRIWQVVTPSAKDATTLPVEHDPKRLERSRTGVLGGGVPMNPTRLVKLLGRRVDRVVPSLPANSQAVHCQPCSLLQNLPTGSSCVAPRRRISSFTAFRWLETGGRHSRPLAGLSGGRCPRLRPPSRRCHAPCCALGTPYCAAQ